MTILSPPGLILPCLPAGRGRIIPGGGWYNSETRLIHTKDAFVESDEHFVDRIKTQTLFE
jgi:hypothetical protein